jgi:hypothetical protein
VNKCLEATLCGPQTVVDNERLWASEGCSNGVEECGGLGTRGDGKCYTAERWQYLTCNILLRQLDKSRLPGAINVLSEDHAEPHDGEQLA